MTLDVVRLVAHAPEQDPAARRLEDRDVEVVAMEDRLRAARPGPVARLDDRAADHDPVGGRRADPLAGLSKDVRDQARRRRLAVRAADRDDRQSPVRVANPGGARPGGLADPRKRSLDLADLPRRELIGRPVPGCRAPRGRGPSRRSRSPGRRASTATRRSNGPGRTIDGRRPRLRRRRDAPDAGAGSTPPARPRAPGWPDLGHRRGEPNQGVPLGLALAVPGPSPADADLDLDRRLEPVEIRTVEQADLDEAHGPARIPTARRRATLDSPA